MTAKIRTLIADDHAIVRMGLRSLVESESDISIVGEASNGCEAVSMATMLTPDVVVMDLLMPKKGGVAATAEIVRHLPSAKIIILTSFDTSDGIAHALECGAAGVVLKNNADMELVEAIRTVAKGGKFIPDAIKRQLSTDPPIPMLTQRQLDILMAISRGFTNSDIAKMLGITEITVRNHLMTIFAKTGASSRAEAVATAIRKHLLEP